VASFIEIRALIQEISHEILVSVNGQWTTNGRPVNDMLPPLLWWRRRSK